MSVSCSLAIIILYASSVPSPYSSPLHLVFYLQKLLFSLMADHREEFCQADPMAHRLHELRAHPGECSGKLVAGEACLGELYRRRFQEASGGKEGSPTLYGGQRNTDFQEAQPWKLPSSTRSPLYPEDLGCSLCLLFLSGMS